MPETAQLPKPGQITRIRQRTYLVEEIVKPKRVADCTLVKLSCVDDDNQGAPLEVLWEKELDPQVLTSEAWDSIAAKGFDESKLFAAYLKRFNRRTDYTAFDLRTTWILECSATKHRLSRGGRANTHWPIPVTENQSLIPTH
jgi:hypothetical protein